MFARHVARGGALGLKVEHVVSRIVSLAVLGIPLECKVSKSTKRLVPVARVPGPVSCGNMEFVSEDVLKKWSADRTSLELPEDAPHAPRRVNPVSAWTSRSPVEFTVTCEAPHTEPTRTRSYVRARCVGAHEDVNLIFTGDVYLPFWPKYSAGTVWSVARARLPEYAEAATISKEAPSVSLGACVLAEGRASLVSASGLSTRNQRNVLAMATIYGLWGDAYCWSVPSILPHALDVIMEEVKAKSPAVLLHESMPYRIDVSKTSAGALKVLGISKMQASALAVCAREMCDDKDVHAKFAERDFIHLAMAYIVEEETNPGPAAVIAKEAFGMLRAAGELIEDETTPGLFRRG